MLGSVNTPPALFNPKRGQMKISCESLIKLADMNVRRYNRMIEAANAGVPNINTSECYQLAATWVSIKTKAQKGSADLSKSEAQEVHDAVYCGEYNWALKPDEVENG